jgi:hypothetical protein
MRKGLTEAGYLATMAEIQRISALTSAVPGIVGPPYGTAMAARASRINLALQDLAEGLEVRALANGFQIPRATPGPDKPGNEARAELDGFDPARHGSPPLSAREHRAFGLRMRETKHRLAHLSASLTNAFPLADPPRLAEKARHVQRAVASFCNYMDEMAYRDCPAQAAREASGLGPVGEWYYGPFPLPASTVPG